MMTETPRSEAWKTTLAALVLVSSFAAHWYLMTVGGPRSEAVLRGFGVQYDCASSPAADVQIIPRFDEETVRLHTVLPAVEDCTGLRMLFPGEVTGVTTSRDGREQSEVQANVRKSNVPGTTVLRWDSTAARRHPDVVDVELRGPLQRRNFSEWSLSLSVDAEARDSRWTAASAYDMWLRLPLDYTIEDSRPSDAQKIEKGVVKVLRVPAHEGGPLDVTVRSPDRAEVKTLAIWVLRLLIVLSAGGLLWEL